MEQLPDIESTRRALELLVETIAYPLARFTDEREYLVDELLRLCTTHFVSTLYDRNPDVREGVINCLYRV